MDDQKLKMLWAFLSSKQSVKIDDAQMLNEISKKTAMMQRGIRHSNNAEISVAVLLIFMFSWTLFGTSQILGKIGATIIILTCVLLIYKLLSNPFRGLSDSTQNALLHLTNSLKDVQKQIKLLNTVLWWYILPFGVGGLCVFYSQSDTVKNRVIYTIVVLSICVFTFYLNKRTVNKMLRPIEESLRKLIEDLSIENLRDQ